MLISTWIKYLLQQPNMSLKIEWCSKFTPCSDVGQTVHPTHSNYLDRVLILYDFLESQSKYH